MTRKLPFVLESSPVLVRNLTPPMLVGDYVRVEAKYGARGLRFLLVEAGHLAQNLCLLASSLALCALPLGGFFEREVARHLALPASDEVLYLLLCGKPSR